jgi:hypothetical protein
MFGIILGLVLVCAGGAGLVFRRRLEMRAIGLLPTIAIGICLIGIETLVPSRSTRVQYRVPLVFVSIFNMAWISFFAMVARKSASRDHSSAKEGASLNRPGIT